MHLQSLVFSLVQVSFPQCKSLKSWNFLREPKAHFFRKIHKSMKVHEGCEGLSVLCVCLKGCVMHCQFEMAIGRIQLSKGAAFDMKPQCFLLVRWKLLPPLFYSQADTSDAFLNFGSFGVSSVQLPATFTPFVRFEFRRLGAVQRLLAPELKGGDAAAEKQAGHFGTESGQEAVRMVSFGEAWMEWIQDIHIAVRARRAWMQLEMPGVRIPWHRGCWSNAFDWHRWELLGKAVARRAYIDMWLMWPTWVYMRSMDVYVMYSLCKQHAKTVCLYRIRLFFNDFMSYLMFTLYSSLVTYNILTIQYVNPK